LIDASCRPQQRPSFHPEAYASAVEAARRAAAFGRRCCPQRWFGRRGAQENFPGNRAGVQRGQRVDAAVQRFVSFAGRVNQ
jgi:hypothetical protein